ncbi:hypothetical protein JOC34_004219 [Virgibacillus halotolerans]|nr:hypothetical protein [Virgibacillus halotolerans]MBM7601790.1 hypothetical protein [Virgibacillus halotolerans]
MRTLGMTIGVTISGLIQGKLLASNLTEGFKEVGVGYFMIDCIQIYR